jgi:hypothetical protein
MMAEGVERGGDARPPTRFFGQPRHRNLPPPPDPADYPLIDDFEVIPVVTPPFGLQMRWQRASGEVLMLFPWYDVTDLKPALDRDQPPDGTMQEPWFHIDQGWFFLRPRSARRGRRGTSAFVTCSCQARAATSYVL